MAEILRPRLDHVKRLFGAHGIVQFAHGSIPDVESGFCLDDNARLLMLATSIRREAPADAFATAAGNVVFDFIDAAASEAPVYHNMMDQFGTFTDRFASPESIGRLVWSLGVVLRDARDKRWLSRARFHLERVTGAGAALSSPHARAFAMLGWAAAIEAGHERYRDVLVAAAEAMNFEYERNATSEWPWIEPVLTYDVARLPEAMMRAGAVLEEPLLAANGRRSFEFLARVTQGAGYFDAIGAPGWFFRGKERPHYSQQPLEALAMVDAWLAYGDPHAARVAFEWFLGRNRDGLVVADLESGGSRDAIHVAGTLNGNMGAESTLAYVQAAYTMRLLEHGVADRLAPAIIGELRGTGRDRDDEVALGA